MVTSLDFLFCLTSNHFALYLLLYVCKTMAISTCRCLRLRLNKNPSLLLDASVMAQHCQCCWDHYKPNLKHCSGCKKVYYCSTYCQDSDWALHIFDCKPHRVKTAHHLARAVYEDVIPSHPQTCEDYGFNRAVTAEEKSKLIGLYIGMSMTLVHPIFFNVHTGLIKLMRIPARTVHDWRISGVLVDEIKAAYFQLPEGSRGLYFPWFLENEHIIALAGQPLGNDA